MIKRLVFATALLTTTFAAMGCSQKIEPQIASSAAEPGYAERYAADLLAAARGLAERRGEAKRVYGSFAAFPARLHGPSWSLVLETVKAADETGRSRAYVERARDTEAAAAFFKAERDEIGRKVAGAAQFAAKNKGCDADVGGAAAGALKDSVDKRLDEHLRAANGAQQLIERRRTQLGKGDATVLERQADDITLASYIVYVELPSLRQRVLQMLDDAGHVKRTAEAFIASERAYQAESKLGAAEQKASEARVEAVRRSAGATDAAVEQAQNAAALFEQEIETAQREYAAALTALERGLDDRAKAAPRLRESFQRPSTSVHPTLQQATRRYR